VLIRQIKNEKGMSLIEVLVAAGLMIIVASGLVGIVTSMNKEQNNQTRISALRELKTRFQFLLSDQNSWNQTLASNATAGNALAVCIKNKTTCSSAGISDLVIRDANNAVFFDPPPFGTAVPAAGSNGFTDKGAPCTAFNGTTGNDLCPITYKVVWEPICPLSGACINPLIRVTVRTMYKPSATAQVTSFSLGNTTGAAGWTDDSNPANTGKYDVVIKRSASSISKAFSYQIISGALGGGSCNVTPAVTTRGAVAPLWTVSSDPFGLATVSAGVFTIKAGTYSCKLTAAGWAVDNFFVQLNQVGIGVVPGSIGTANASSTSYVQSIATSNPVLSLSADTDFRVEQSCQVNSIAPTNFNMGMPSVPYGIPSILATLTCTQTN
jgi:type II secretory pathway pseudopilin PulG